MSIEQINIVKDDILNNKHLLASELSIKHKISTYYVYKIKWELKEEGLLKD